MADKVTYAYLKWSGGTHRFSIDLSALFTFHPIPDPFARLQRLITGQWSAEDVYGTIRRALGSSQEAADLFEDNCGPDRPIGDLVPLAQTIMSVTIFGLDEETANAGLEPAAVTPEAGDDD